MNTTPHYDLLPIMWWENPWIVGGIAAATGIMIVVLYLAWRVIRARHNKPIPPREQWLIELRQLQASINAHECTIDHSYQELMRIMREYAHAAYGIHDISYTDEEFIQELLRSAPSHAEYFVSIVEKIRGDVYEAKFAHTLFPAEQVQSYIRDLIAFLEQENKKSPDKNT